VAVNTKFLLVTSGGKTTGEPVGASVELAINKQQMRKCSYQTHPPLPACKNSLVENVGFSLCRIETKIQKFHLRKMHEKKGHKKSISVHLLLHLHEEIYPTISHEPRRPNVVVITGKYVGLV
jgi:hypothetical protein